MTITVALGTSTPTSITTVAINASISPARKRSITASRSSRFIRPCIPARRRPASGPCANISRCDATSLSPKSDSSTAGTTMNACSPRAMRSLTNLYASRLRASVRMRVCTGERLSGRCKIVDTSRSPYTVSESVRGIGVAVITNMCGVCPCGALPRNNARCATPKRCCSSITAMANA